MPQSFWETLPRPIIALAPMEGYTNTVFRQLARQHGADVVYTEFISADAIAHGAPAVLKKLDFDPSEQPVICQIFGRDPRAFAQAATIIEQRGYAGIDINCGCPARKVVGAGAGVALLRDPHYLRSLVEATLASTNLPVSLKVRSSIRKERKEVAPGIQERYTALDLVEAIKDLPVHALMVHGRSFEAGHSGDVDSAMIREVKKRFRGVVLANGGITTPEDVQRMLTETGADGVGIARGAIGHPWIFSQTHTFLQSGSYTAPTSHDIRDTIIKQAEMTIAAFGERAIIDLRKQLAGYVKGFDGASQLRQKLVRVSSIEDIQQALR